MKKGLVKSVQSGDSLLLEGNAPPGQQPPQKTISLAYLEVPTLALPGMTSDPWAWESREFLRNLVIGKRVDFKIEYTLKTSDYCSIFIDNTWVNEEIIKQGLGKVRASRTNEQVQQLQQAEGEARAAQRGIWSRNTPPQITIQPSTDYSTSHLVGGTHSCIIEEVINAMTLNVLILQDMGIAKVNIEGIYTPAPNQKVGLEGKLLTQRLLQHRQVQCEVIGRDQQNIITAKILHPQGDIAVLLLKKGYARITQQCNEQAISSAYYRGLKSAQTEAQQQRLNIWQEFQAQRVNVTESKFEGTVVEIHSGDSLTVVNNNSSQPRRVYLASVRAPALGNPRKQTEDAPWAYDAKEFLRRTAIGKIVNVEIEYAKKIQNEQIETNMEFATLMMKSQNISCLLLQQGLANVVPPRSDEEGSKYLQELRAAEDSAKQNHRGLFSNQSPPNHRITDLITQGSQQKIRTFTPALVGQVHLGIIDHIFTGTRFKIRIPKENCAVMFAIQGIRSYAQEPNQPEQDRLAKDAIEYARNHVLQREVDCQITAVDKRGTFLGTVFLQRNNYAIGLVEEGLAFTSGPRTQFSQQYSQAEQQAQKAGKGVHNQRVAGLMGQESIQQLQSVQCFMTEIVDASKFYVQFANDSNSQRVNKIMASFDPAAAQPLQNPIKQGVLCAALFSDDNQWYRARIERKIGDKYRVLFIDFGNSEDVSPNNLRQLNAQAIEIPPVTHECRFAYIQPASLSWGDIGYTAGEALRELSWQQNLYIKITNDNRGLLSVVLSKQQDQTDGTIDCELVARGLAKVDRQVRYNQSNPYIQPLVQREEQAKRNGIGIWSEDFEDDEDY